MADRIAKQRLNVVVLVDCSTSMRGQRIEKVNRALADIKRHLSDMQDENSNVDFYVSVITYSTEAHFLNGEQVKPVQDFVFSDIRAGGWSNLHLAYGMLGQMLQKESKGGIMPDFGGVAPILLLLTDGHPTKWPLKAEMSALKKLPWFQVAIKYGIAIELKDRKTMDVLTEFVGGNGDVIECYDAKLLERIIQIIVLTASKVKSTSASVHAQKHQPIAVDIRQKIGQALSEVDNWEW